MKKNQITIQVKRPNQKREYIHIDVDMDYKGNEDAIKNIGESFSRMFEPETEVIVEYNVFSQISGTWLSMVTYFCNIKN